MLSTKMIGNKIALARKKLNISQAQLAGQLFISSQAVGKWERGESMPDITTFSRLAEILAVDLNYFTESQAINTSANGVNVPLEDNLAELDSGKKKKKLSWDMSRGNWVDADFSALKKLKDKFSESNMQRCKFIASDLSGLLLKSNNIEECDFSNSNIRNSQIKNSYLVGNKFQECSLNETEFSGSYVKDCDFSNANLSEVKFSSGSFLNNKTEDAIWQQTSFLGMQLENLVFNGSVDDCYFENCSFKKFTFKNARITNTFFKSRKLKGIKFIDSQADRMTYEFLKNGKADLSGLSLLATKKEDE